MHNSRRPDLSKAALLAIIALTIVCSVAVAIFASGSRPGKPATQLAAILGTVLLLVPMLFSMLKRSNVNVNPPWWFVAHVVSACAGSVLICAHVAGGNWFSPPGLLLLALLFLLVQGTVARAFLSARISLLFAASPASFNFDLPPVTDRERLARIIQAKQRRLARLAPHENEATFSLGLAQWIGHPVQSANYWRLVRSEQRMVGARRRAGWLLSSWRPLHIIAAALFFAGLVAHVVVMLFFAGYAAGDGDVYWWHITAWGSPT